MTTYGDKNNINAEKLHGIALERRDIRRWGGVAFPIDHPMIGGVFEYKIQKTYRNKKTLKAISSNGV